MTVAIDRHRLLVLCCSSRPPSPSFALPTGLLVFARACCYGQKPRLTRHRLSIASPSASFCLTSPASTCPATSTHLATHSSRLELLLLCLELRLLLRLELLRLLAASINLVLLPRPVLLLLPRHRCVLPYELILHIRSLCCYIELQSADLQLQFASTSSYCYLELLLLTSSFCNLELLLLSEASAATSSLC